MKVWSFLDLPDKMKHFFHYPPPPTQPPTHFTQPYPTFACSFTCKWKQDSTTPCSQKPKWPLHLKFLYRSQWESETWQAIFSYLESFGTHETLIIFGPPRQNGALFTFTPSPSPFPTTHPLHTAISYFCLFFHMQVKTGLYHALRSQNGHCVSKFCTGVYGKVKLDKPFSPI